MARNIKASFFPAVLVLSIVALIVSALNPAQTAKQAETNDKTFHKKLREIADNYSNYDKVDNTPRQAPAMCAMIGPVRPTSSSNDASTHGQKTYFLFAKDKKSYLDLTDAKVGQAIVKESWTKLKPGEAALGKETSMGETKYGLFIMAKLDPKTPNTDNGWIYGTVSPDGKSVSSSGRVQSCMSCHEQAQHDRLFGLKKD